MSRGIMNYVYLSYFCKLYIQVYNPKKLKEAHPEYNTMTCEQTFSWLSRFKKILTAMPKIHHHFYLHQMVKRRNKYISYCYIMGKRPVQPTVKERTP